MQPTEHNAIRRAASQQASLAERSARRGRRRRQRCQIQGLAVERSMTSTPAEPCVSCRSPGERLAGDCSIPWNGRFGGGVSTCAAAQGVSARMQGRRQSATDPQLRTYRRIVLASGQHSGASWTPEDSRRPRPRMCSEWRSILLGHRQRALPDIGWQDEDAMQLVVLVLLAAQAQPASDWHRREPRQHDRMLPARLSACPPVDSGPPPKLVRGPGRRWPLQAGRPTAGRERASRGQTWACATRAAAPASAASRPRSGRSPLALEAASHRGSPS